MKNKNGFTLVELIVTIALMLSILTMAIVSFINISNKRKEDSYLEVKKQIITAAEHYFEDNSYYKESLTDDYFLKVSVGELVEEDYLNAVTNPVTGEKLNYCNYVKVTKNDKSNSLNYEFFDDKENCETNSYVDVEPVMNIGDFTYEPIGTKGNDGWYKINENYDKESNEIDKISPGVVVKLTATVRNYDYYISSIKACDGNNVNNCNVIWNSMTDSSNSDDFNQVVAYDTNTYSKTTEKSGKKIKYMVVYSLKEKPETTIVKSRDANYMVDVNAPTCTSKIIGAQDNETKNYYCYRPPFSLVPFCPSCSFSTNDIGSGIEQDLDKKFRLLSFTNDITETIRDKAGNNGTCKLKINFEKKDAFDTIDDILSNAEFCGKTEGESTVWTNTPRTITQHFIHNNGDEYSSPVTKKFSDSGQTKTITSAKGTSCTVNTYIDKEPPKFQSTGLDAHLIQKDSKGTIIKDNIITLTSVGNNTFTGDICLINKAGSFSIGTPNTSASDNLSGINKNSWVITTRLTNRNGATINGCLRTRGDNPCTYTFEKYVSDNAGNQGKIATYKFRVGYINNGVSGGTYDSFCN